MGGDLVAVLHPGRGAGDPAALVAVGAAGSGADAAAQRAEGHSRMPYRGDIRTVTMPGCVDGWLALHARLGRRPLAEVLAPACLLYTSDAADEEDSVDLGGRRIIKKKKK